GEEARARGRLGARCTVGRRGGPLVSGRGNGGRPSRSERKNANRTERRPGGGTRRDRPDGARDQRTDPVRAVARDALRAVREQDAYANLVLPRLLRERGLSGRDAALATEITYGACRSLSLLDAVIAGCAGR